MSTLIIFSDRYWPLVIVATLLVLLSYGFLFNFCRQALRLGEELGKAIQDLKAIRLDTKGPIVNLANISDKAMQSPPLAHLWGEYAKTLHPQSKEGSDGQVRIIKPRLSTGDSEVRVRRMHGITP